jgi:hypothetical protein
VRDGEKGQWGNKWGERERERRGQGEREAGKSERTGREREHLIQGLMKRERKMLGSSVIKILWQLVWRSCFILIR